MQRPAIYVLGGGRSRRFGQDKARADVGGVTLIESVCHALGDGEAPTVVADVDDKYADLGLRTIGDSGQHFGPIDGLRAALADLAPDVDWLLLAACDQARIRSEWVDALVAARTPSVDAVIFEHGDAHPEPLFALYHRRCLPTVDDQIAQGSYAMWRLLRRLTIAQAEPAAGFAELANINCPGDLAEHLRPASKSGDAAD